MSGTLPQLDFASYSSQLFWLFITFFVLYFSISRFFLPNISELIKKRGQYIDNIESQIEREKVAIQKIEDKQYKLISRKNEETSLIIKEANNKASKIIEANNILMQKNLTTLNNQMFSELNGAVEIKKSDLLNQSSKIVEVFIQQFELNFTNNTLKSEINRSFENIWHKQLQKMKN